MTISVSGNTYPVRELLSAQGGIWNPGAKSWTFTAEQWAEVERRSSPSFGGRKIARLVGELKVAVSE
jgi:hypothetical protein